MIQHGSIQNSPTAIRHRSQLSRVQSLHHAVRDIQLIIVRRLIALHEQLLDRPLRLHRPRDGRETHRLRVQLLRRGREEAEAEFRVVQRALREEADASGQGVDFAAERVGVGIVVVEKPQARARGGVDCLCGQQMLQRARFPDDGTERKLSTGLGDEPGGILILANESVWASEPHVHLTAQFLSASEGATVDLGDEGCTGDILQHAPHCNESGQGHRAVGGRSLEVIEIEMADEEVRIGGAEDDDFGRGSARCGLNRDHEVIEVGDEWSRKQIYGGIVDCDAGDIGDLGNIEVAIL